VTAFHSKYASSLILFEWGAIMLYFNLSGRVSAFLHPNFRPLLWIVGVMLVLTAFITVFAGGSGCCDNNGHVHDCGVDHPEHAHHENKANRRLTATGVVSFLVLCFPTALAAVISPDSFGESFLRNRGVVQTIQQPDKTALAAAQSSAASSNDVALEQKVFVSDQNSQQALGNERVDAKSVGPASAEPTLPSSEEVSANDNASSNEQDEEDENPALRPDREGNIHAEVIDLLYACEDPSIRKDFDGKHVA
jgi:hypothetical protein